MRKAAITLVMLVLGIASLSAFAAVVEVRHGSELLPSTRPAEGRGLATVSDSLASLVVEARDALAAGRAGRAAPVLDAAMRLAMVAEHAAPEGADAAFAEAHRRIEEARLAMQNGRRRRALDRLDQTAVTLREEKDFAEAAPHPPSGGALRRYRGAAVLDRSGVRVGELVGWESSRASEDDAVIVLGGPRDVLGFIDFPGTRITVPSRDLLYGPDRALGPTLVVLPRQLESG